MQQCYAMSPCGGPMLLLHPACIMAGAPAQWVTEAVLNQLNNLRHVTVNTCTKTAKAYTARPSNGRQARVLCSSACLHAVGCCHSSQACRPCGTTQQHAALLCVTHATAAHCASDAALLRDLRTVQAARWQSCVYLTESCVASQ
jgi:hypothetical protein